MRSRLYHWGLATSVYVLTCAVLAFAFHAKFNQYQPNQKSHTCSSTKSNKPSDERQQQSGPIEDQQPIEDRWDDSSVRVFVVRKDFNPLKLNPEYNPYLFRAPPSSI